MSFILNSAVEPNTGVSAEAVWTEQSSLPVGVMIADPGDAGAIPVATGGTVALVTAGAETRTLADPTFFGQQLTLYFLTDGGDCVVTAATPVNTTNDNTITFSVAGDTCFLTAVPTNAAGTTFAWRAITPADDVTPAFTTV